MSGRGLSKRKKAARKARAADEAERRLMEQEVEKVDAWSQGRMRDLRRGQEGAIARARNMPTGEAELAALQGADRFMAPVEGVPTYAAPGVAGRYQARAMARASRATQADRNAAALTPIQQQAAATERAYATDQARLADESRDWQMTHGFEQARLGAFARRAATNSAQRWRKAGRAGQEQLAYGSLINSAMGAGVNVAGAFA